MLKTATTKAIFSNTSQLKRKRNSSDGLCSTVPCTIFIGRVVCELRY